MATYTYSIAADTDDGQETDGTTWNAKLDDGYPTGEYFSVFGTGGVNDTNGALRFVASDLVQGQTITSSTLTINSPFVDNIDPTNSVVTIHGDLTNNSGALGSGHRPSSGWTNTSASASISSLTTGARAITVTSIVQEIVNQAGFTGPGVSFALRPTGSDTYWLYRVVDYDADTMANIATLQVVVADGAVFNPISGRGASAAQPLAV